MNMKKLITSALLVSALAPMAAFAQEDITKKLSLLEDRISELEANQSLNIFKFGGLLETRYDNITAKQTDPTSSAIDSKVDYLRLRASFDMSADVSKNIKVYSRYTMTKFSNIYYTQSVGTGSAPVTSADLSAAKEENGAQVYVEKFYADATVPDTGVVFSFGRLPISDGPPFHFPNGRPRTGTYPGLLYNGQLDGVALTYNKPVADGTFSVRGVHTPMTVLTSSSGKLSGARGVISNPTDSAGNTSRTMRDLDTLMLEFNSNKISFADNISIILQAFSVSLTMAGNQLSSTGTTAGNASGDVDFKIEAQALYLGVENIGHIGLDLSATHLMSQVTNDGCMTFGGAPCTDAYISAGAAIAGFGATTRGEKMKGSSTLLTARYRIISPTYFGVEYLMGGKNVYVFDQNSDNIVAFYDTPGTGTHAYILHKFTNDLGLRLGYMQQDYKSTVFGFGPSKDTDRKVTTYYANLRLDF